MAYQYPQPIRENTMPKATSIDAPEQYDRAEAAIWAEGYNAGYAEAYAQFSTFMGTSIDNRMAWANSPDGHRALGPGIPAVPGLQDLHFILKWVNARQREFARSAPLPVVLPISNP